MSASAPRVSVAIPTWRGDATLGAAIESVLAQDFGDLELIVVDDNSPDGTRELVEGYRDARLRYLRNPTNLGPEGNWNSCRELARGAYFKLLPHDDVLHRQCLARQVTVLDEDRDEHIALVFCARDVLAPQGRVLMQRRYPGASAGRLPAREVLAACVRRGTNLIGEPGGVLWRRSLGNRVGRFDATNPYVIDLDYWARLLAHGDAHYCDEPLVGFRVSGGSWSVAIGSGQSSDFRRFVRRLSDRGVLHPGLLDRMLGQVTPTLNNWARMMFYRLYLR